jgi:Spy/CpxP family protein refolding chaperone
MNGRDIKPSWVISVFACVIAVTLTSSAGAAPPDAGPAPAGDAAKPPPPPKHGKAPPAKGAPGPHAKGGPGAAPQPYGYPNGFIERHAKRLELSDETVKAIRDVAEKSRVDNERLRKEVDHAQAGLRKLLAQDLPDEKAVMAQADKITELVGEQRKSQLRSAIKVRSMLTPKQRAELDKIRKEQTPPRHGGPGAPPPPPHEQKKPPFGAGGTPPAKPAAKPQAAD